MGLLKERGKQRTDSTRILAAVRRGLNRLELVGETMRHALDVKTAFIWAYQSSSDIFY